MKSNEVVLAKFTKEEMETHYYINADSDDVVVYSNISKDIRKFEKAGWQLVSVQKYTTGEIAAATYKAPKNMLSVRTYNPNRAKRTPSQKAIEALKKYREGLQE